MKNRHQYGRQTHPRKILQTPRQTRKQKGTNAKRQPLTLATKNRQRSDAPNTPKKTHTLQKPLEALDDK